ncbi:hypothetical protein J2W25_003664 [Variovorax boronicumulans]|uniref:DUF2827 domain-containing protein n=1 Tax=Variovorax boronicumulans TaxID=436515 RepID=A0AAW8DYD2_9BURK|nr:DUF2827 domain-containing protein [Variovorax boronicumulans]MDP9879694.1 hypothetical protein [Variovorax boronicumulans]MDP9924628.1 hypothetical protein [Variovorax boronicumulans]
MSEVHNPTAGPRAAASPTRLKVGVSIFIRKGEQSLWENGVYQNCLFLVMLLLRSPCVERTVLVAGGGDGGPADATNFLADSPVPIIDMATAAHELDLMIEMSAQLGRDWSVAFRERGGKIVSMRVGNDYVIDIERMTFNKPHGMLVSGAPYDEVWTLPEYETSCKPYFASTFRAPTKLMPHLWSPMVVEKAMARGAEGKRFAYEPGRKQWRVAIFEPNICMVKTSFIPMLGCESAHRAQPRLIEKMWVYNSFHLKDKPNFVAFAQSLDLVRHGLATFEGRFPLYQVLPGAIDAVFAHHWENAQNYLYYEALYGGWPLIHNSHLIGDCGYRYHGFDCEEGGQALRRAFAEHDANLPAYRERARALIARLDPEGEENVRLYSAAIESLYA